MGSEQSFPRYVRDGQGDVWEQTEMDGDSYVCATSPSPAGVRLAEIAEQYGGWEECEAPVGRWEE